MRVWLVPLSELSDKHLWGQHREFHMLVSMIKSPRFKNHPLVKFYHDKLSWLKDYHGWLVDEMQFRKGTQDLTPAPASYAGPAISIEFPAAWIEFDQQDLARRYKIRSHVWTKRSRPIWAGPNPKQIRGSCGFCVYKKACTGPPNAWTFCDAWEDEDGSGLSYQMKEPIPLYQLMRPESYGQYFGDAPKIHTATSVDFHPEASSGSIPNG